MTGCNDIHFKLLLGGSAVLRLLLIAWGEFQDRNFEVKYTDIDYHVFTDAAWYVTRGKSPYERSTYRYSPLLSYLMVPNICLHNTFGKLMFCGGDMLVAMLIIHILRAQRAAPLSQLIAASAWLCNPYTLTISTRGSCDVLAALLLMAMLILIIRSGSKDKLPVFGASLLYGLVVHMRIYPLIYAPSLVLFLSARAIRSAVKLRRPHLYNSKYSASPCLSGSLWKHLTCNPYETMGTIIKEASSFGFASATMFFVLGSTFYSLYGTQFIQEAFLHHTHRRDPRHNFSPHFYPIYLSMYGHQQMSASAPTSYPGDVAQSVLSAIALDLMHRVEVIGPALDDIVGLGVSNKTASQSSHPDSHILYSTLRSSTSPDVSMWTSLLQLLLQLLISVCLHEDLPSCLLIQTMAFVTLNKVCTAQYFVWYFSLIPLVLPRVMWPLSNGLKLALLGWVLSQVHWLLWGYALEFQGGSVYLPLWAASVAFQLANAFLMVQLLYAIYTRNYTAGAVSLGIDYSADKCRVKSGTTQSSFLSFIDATAEVNEQKHDKFHID
ncbi:hypothetical protein CEUSTIGMA_g9612.t1 [Chlamydomonas eustigma]|uniref:GPI mannosyltransferase 1 n=1 Tax=Chlamydomonas eustigma TaxID=1157962 RepID=A0A250XGI0_9CHLO|nr:hypothetical protein CEUSTIGMA_g9612.t1 [Chlamydomonas eustigma]|eukprot:GAX82184.1 hypothetical protein CEUSTIGMA_g9612.t1 [Chlamydomonas eustigma]